MAFKLGSNLGTDSSIGTPNQGLSRYAQARLDNTVARAVRRHQEALRVDAIGLYIWRRQSGGLICTCRQPQKPISHDQEISSDVALTVDQLRQRTLESSTIPAGGEVEDISFKVYHMRGQTGAPLSNPALPPDFEGLVDPNSADNNLEGDQSFDGVNSLAPLDEADNDISDEDLARIYSEGGAIFGGDKTPCGICFGTGRTHGYELATGRRMILDASNEWLFSLSNAEINNAKFPSQFKIGSRSDSAVVWTVDIPTFTHGWLAVAVRNNLEPANNLIVQWLRSGVWQSLTPAALLATDGTDRRGSQIRVVNNGQVGLADNMFFTHVEMTYASAPPVPAQLPPINITTNFDVRDPVITSEFEVIGKVDDIPRESVFQDTKYKYLWKVVDVTPKVTAAGQVFGFTLNARTVHTSEMFYALKVLTDPFVTVNYRGLERVQGALSQQYWSDSVNVPDEFTFPEHEEDAYNTPES